MAEQDRPAVGSVAQEAARLLDALGEWAHSSTDHSSTGHGTSEHGNAEPSTAGPAPEEPPRGHAARPEPPGGKGRCEHCGADTGLGRAVACQLCPICQGIGILRSVRPETVDRLADLAGAVTTALRDLAATQRRASGEDRAREKSAGRAAAVQDITIEDEESGAP